MAAPLRPGQLTLISLAAAAAVLLVVIAWETGWGEGLHARLPAKPLPAAAPVEPKLLPQLVASAPEQAWPETATRPIFVPGRRPAPALNAPSAMRKGQFILQGTTIVGPLSIAMLKETSTGKLYRLEKGRELQGMTLAEVAPDRVTLRTGEDSETLLLMVTKAAAAAPGAPPPFVQSGPFTSPVPESVQPPRTAAMPAATSGTQGPVGASGGPQAATLPRPSAAAAAAAGLPAGMPTGAPPAASTDSSAMTPEEILARRRAARRSQQTN